MRRKRQYSEGSEQDDSSSTARLSRQYDSHMSRGGKKARREVTRADRLEILVFKLAERDAGIVESDIERLAEVLLAEFGGEYQSKVNELLHFCVYAVPEKLTIYSTLVGVMNARNSNFGASFLQSLWTHLHRCLSKGKFLHVQRIIRFICDMLNSKVISPESLLNLLATLINTACGESENIGSERRSDFFIYIVLSSLPWCGKTLHETRPQALTQLLNSIYEYVQGSNSPRKKLHLPLLQVWTATEPHFQEDYLDCLVEQIRNLVADDWIESQIYRPYHSFDSILCDAIPHQFPQLELLTADEEESNELIYPLPKVVFRMFDYTDVPEKSILPGSHSIERYLVEDQLNNIIDTYYLERKPCAMYLVNHKAISNMPLDYMIIEVIFSQLFTLPTPPHIELFYGALLIELCKMKPSSIPQVLAQSTELIFDRLPTMKAVCIERYINWFSYNLSNFQLRWSWDYWSYVFAEGDKSVTQSKCDQPSLSTNGEQTTKPDEDKTKEIRNYESQVKLHFIREVMRKLIRFSYRIALLQTTPTCFHQLVPDKLIPLYKYGDSGGSGRNDSIEDIDEEELQARKSMGNELSPGTRVIAAGGSVPDVTSADVDEEVIVDEEDEYGNTVVVIRKTEDPAQVARKRKHTTACAFAAKLRSALEERDTTLLEIQQILQAATSTWPDLDRITILDVFFSSVLYMGSKTFSHTYAGLVRYHTILRSLLANAEEERQLALMDTVYSVWHRHQQMIVFLVDRIQRAQIVDCIAIATWIFSKKMQDQLMSLYVWEILHNLIQFECDKLAMLNKSCPPIRRNKSQFADTKKKSHCQSSIRDNNDDDLNDESGSDEECVASKEMRSQRSEQERIVKNLFLTVLQRIVVVISDYIESFEHQQRVGQRPLSESPFCTTWYKWMSERMQAILLSFHNELRLFRGALEALIFTPDVQFSLLDVFKQFCSIHV